MPTLNNVCCNQVYHRTLWVRLGSTPEDSQDPFPALPQAHRQAFPLPSPSVPTCETKRQQMTPKQRARHWGAQENLSIDGGRWAPGAWPGPTPRCDTARLPARPPAQHPPLSPRAVPQQQRSPRITDRPLPLSTRRAPLRSPQSWMFSRSSPAPSPRQQARAGREPRSPHIPVSSAPV